MALLNSFIQIGPCHLANRLVLPPMATSKAVQGAVSPELLEYYRQKTAGQHIGLVISEHAYVNLQGRASEHQLSASRDEDVAGLTALTELIHQSGSRVFLQISHAGGRAKSANPLAPSAMAGAEGIMAQAMTPKQIDQVVEDFAMAAGRAKAAGFDGVEIHSAHGYLLNQFYSPLINRRSDEYGLDLDGRIRLHLRIIARVREQIGNDLALLVRLGVCDQEEGGSTVQDALRACAAFEQAGVDGLDISGGMKGYLRPGHSEQGYYQDYTEQIKNNVSLPVILTGGIQDALEAERLLQENKADLIGVGRAILKGSDWPQQAWARLASL